MFDIDGPEFRALNREASLAAHLVANGVTTLGKASSSKTGLYAQAFFDLSIGLERIAKLAVMLDHLMGSGGKFPTDKELRGYGHNLTELFVTLKALRVKYPSSKSLAAYPAGDIERAIIEFLSEFAVSTRYYNLDYLVDGKAKAKGDPIANWWAGTGTLILAQHYKKKQKDSDEARALSLGGVLDQFSSIKFSREDGSAITDGSSMLMHSSQTDLVQKWAPLYVLRLIRFATILVCDLGNAAQAQHGILVPYMSDHFRIFYNEDSYFKTRRTWEPI